MAGFLISRTDSNPPRQSSAKLPEPVECVSNDYLHEIVQKAVQNTRATGAAIALGHPEEMVCRATAGECPSDIGAKINSASGLTGLSASSGMIQHCMNTELDPRVDAEACRELGIAAIIVVPLFCQDHLLGLLEVFSQRPYAFGMRDLQVLEALSEEFRANLPRNVESTDETIHEVRSVSNISARVKKISFYMAAVVTCFLVGLSWGWKLTDPMTDSVKGKVTLIFTVPAASPQVSLSHLVEGTLVHRVDPTYPEDAWQRRIHGPGCPANSYWQGRICL
jgi:GAF domain